MWSNLQISIVLVTITWISKHRKSACETNKTACKQALHLGKRSEPPKHIKCDRAAVEERRVCNNLSKNFHLYFAQTKRNTIGWKMTLQKLKLIDNRPSWPALAGNVETRQNLCYVEQSLSSLRKRKPAKEENSSLLMWEITVVCVVAYSKSNVDLKPIIMELKTCFSPQSRRACLM